MSARIGIVGARRSAQGLGPFVARDFEAAGCQVVGFTTSCSETLAEAQEQLAEWGVRAIGYDSLSKLIDAQPVDALAILSPSQTHEAFLHEAAAAGLHVLCEKPLVWGGRDLGGRAQACVAAFEQRALLLEENCQWPWVLSAFRDLHPGSLREVPAEFSMRLTPDSTGEQAIGDCLSHPLSVLQILTSATGALTDLQVSRCDSDPKQLQIDFELGRTAVRLEFFHSDERPRPAVLAIDGQRAERRIVLPDYRMELADGDRWVGLPDPLRGRISSFVQALDSVRAGGAPPCGQPLVQRMAWIEQVLSAYFEQVDPGA